MWILFSVLAGTCFSLSSLVSRYVLRAQKDSWAFSFFYSVIGALVVLPLFIFKAKVSDEFGDWLILILVSFLIVFHNYLLFKATNFLEASVTGSVLKFRLVFVFVFAVILSNTDANLAKIIGIIFAIISGVILLSGIGKRFSRKGIILTLLSTIVYASVVTIYSTLLESFNAISLTFFIFFIPGLINFVVIPDRVKRITKIILEDKKGIILASVFGALANIFIIQAFDLGDETSILLISEAFLIFTLLGEHIFLKEKEGLLKKILALIFASLAALVFLAV
ncbi:MAG TPA: DMT family transporter [Candidatus Dojkabacteria bacterium]|jgi:drug/metabolite transporter (DMT)-like permease